MAVPCRRGRCPWERGLGNLVRPGSHPEPRRFTVQWADPVVSVGREAIASRSAPPSCSCCHESIGLFAPFCRPPVPM